MENKPKLSSFTSIFEGAIDDYKNRFKSIVVFSSLSIAAGIVMAIFAILGLLAMLFVNSVLGMVLMIVGFAVFFIAASVVSGAFMYAMKDNADIKESFLFIKENIWSFLWIMLLVGLAVMTGVFLLIIPGIIISVLLSFSLIIFMDKKTKGINALAESREYIRGYFWSVFGRTFLYGLIVFAAGACVGVIGAVLSVILPFLPNIIQGLFNTFVVTPISLCFTWRLYKDLKEKNAGASSAGSKPRAAWIKVFVILGMAIITALTVLSVVFLPAIIKKAAEIKAAEELKNTENPNIEIEDFDFSELNLDDLSAEIEQQ